VCSGGRVKKTTSSMIYMLIPQVLYSICPKHFPQFFGIDEQKISDTFASVGCPEASTERVN
jgi:hypothetical protein